MYLYRLKRWGLRLIVIVAVFGLGWALGYIKWPYFSYQISYWVGFLGGFGLMLLIWAIWLLISSIPKLNQENVNGFIKQKTSLILGLVALVGLGSAFFNAGKLSSLRHEIKQQESLSKEQRATIHQLKSKDFLTAVTLLTAQAEKEIESSENRKLSGNTIQKIASLNESFQLGRYIDKDGYIISNISLERGQLLLRLISMKMDSSSFASIKQKVSFDHADLQGANLDHANLSHINLNHANIKKASLQFTNLSHAQLNEADLSQTQLNTASALNANLTRANLQGAVLNYGDFSGAKLDGADLSNSLAKSTNFSGSDIQWCRLSGADWSRANLKEANLTGDTFFQSKLNGANLFLAIVKRSEIKETELNNIKVEVDWIEKTAGWSMAQSDYIAMNYQLKKDTILGQDTLYRLMLNRP